VSIQAHAEHIESPYCYRIRCCHKRVIEYRPKNLVHQLTRSDRVHKFIYNVALARHLLYTPTRHGNILHNRVVLWVHFKKLR